MIVLLRIVLLFAVTSTLVACGGTVTVRLPDGTLKDKRVGMAQSGVVVAVVNNCAPLLDIESLNSRGFKGARYSETIRVTATAEPYSVYITDRRVQITVKAFTANRADYLGSSTHEFVVHSYEGTHGETLVVDKLKSPTIDGGCRKP